MEIFSIENDLKTVCITADSFPAGIHAAHDKIRSLAPASRERNYFGVSRPDKNGVIIYKAATTELFDGELSGLDLEEFTIPRGKYALIHLHNFRENISSIASAFEQIIHSQPIDPNGFCLEWYLDDDNVRCMIKLRS
jgi:hypothetical protein